MCTLPPPCIFQREMEEVLPGVPNVVIYLDDILALSPSEEHVKLLEEILGHLHKSAQLGFRQSSIWVI